MDQSETEDQKKYQKLMEDYETEGVEYIDGFGDQYYSLKKLKTKGNNDPNTRSYLVAKYWKDEIKGYNILLKTKELSIIIPTRFDEVTDPEYDKKAVWMIYEDLQIQSPNYLNPEQRLISAIQLGFSLKRLEEQGINLKITESMLIVHEGRLYLTLKNYLYVEADKPDYSQYECIAAYKEIRIYNEQQVKLLLPNILLNQSTYTQIIDYLVETIKPNAVNHFNCPYLWLLEKIIKPQEPIKQTDYQGNSFIYELKVPDSLKYKQRNPHKSEIIIKSTKLPDQSDRDYTENDSNLTNQNVNRELEIFESFGPDEHVLQSWGYIKIYTQTFIFMDKNYDLAEYMNWIRTQNLYGYRIFIKLALEFSKSLLTLHNHGYKHRDLKEGNLFVSQKDKNFGRLLVGDFDRSKHKDIVQTYSNVSQMTQGYNPPEVVNDEGHTQASDIWQFGLILCKIATPHFAHNEFQYGMFLAERRAKQQNPQLVIKDPAQDPFKDLDKLILSEFAKEQLDENQRAKSHQVLIRIIPLILKCLEEDQQRRPTANKIHVELDDLYWNVIAGIRKGGTSSPQRVNSNNNNTNSNITLVSVQTIPNDPSPMRQCISPTTPTIRIISQKTIS